MTAAAAVGDHITWYENKTSGFGAQHMIGSATDGPRAVRVADLNQEGQPDVLSASAWDDKGHSVDPNRRS